MADKIKLLICDDEVKFLESIAERLELRGFDVTKATSGKDAVEAARTGGFDLAILDLKMPGMNGIEVLEILKKEHKYLEVIILTGHGSIDSAVESTKLGAFSYLSKPYDLDDLLKSLKDAYETRMKKKFEDDTERMDEILKMAQSMSPLGFLREVKKLDDEEK
ncbi:MAG: response regulator [candidate division Zixibacteria bacterium]|nr:response regulator [candidate division Zixibacteria bacterium]